MLKRINWCEIGDKQNLHLSHRELRYIKERVKDKFGTLYVLGKKLDLGVSVLYSKLQYENQGMSVSLLKKILTKLEIPYDVIGRQPIAIGRYNYATLRFPITPKPVYGQLLAHAFFDGYCDDFILRYSNYDEDIREEFCSTVRKAFPSLKFNKPRNVRQDIDLPVFVSRFLKNIFGVKTFYSDRCRIPRKFFDVIRYDNLFGWYFLKGAYLDDGTITGGQLWIVRGIKNRGLIRDMVKLTRMVGINAKIRETRRGYHSLMVCENSYKKFYEKISGLMRNDLKKWGKVSQKINSWQVYKKREKKVIDECEKIIELASKRKHITSDDVKILCKLPKSTAYFRLHLLVYNGNLSKQKKGKESIYQLKRKSLSNLKSSNEMRRDYGWR